MEQNNFLGNDRAQDIANMQVSPENRSQDLQKAMKMALENGKVSQEEAKALLEKFQSEKQQIMDFLLSQKEGVIQNAQWDLLEASSSMMNFLPKESLKNTISTSLNQETLEKFLGEKTGEILDVFSLLEENGVHLGQIFDQYNKKIQNFEGKLPPDFLEKLYEAIGKKVVGIANMVVEFKASLDEKNHSLQSQVDTLKSQGTAKNLDKIMELTQQMEENSFSHKRWIFAEEIQNQLGEFNEKIFPSLEFYTKYQEGVQIPNQYTRVEMSSRGMNMNPDFVRVGSKLSAIDALLQAEVDEEGSFDLSLIDSQTLLSSGSRNEGNMLKDMGVESQFVDVLSQEDRALENDVTIKCLALTVASCVPYAGGAVSVGTDLSDVFSSQDGALLLLKQMDLTPDDYQMSKDWTQNLGAAFSLALTPMGFQGALRAPKILKVVQKLEKSGMKFDDVMKRLEEMVKVIQEKLFGPSKNIPNSETKMNTNIPASDAAKEASDSKNSPEFSPEFHAELEKIGGASKYGVDMILKMEKAFRHSGVPMEEIFRNSKWVEEGNFSLPGKILGRELSQEEIDLLIYIHEDVSRGLYKNESRDLFKIMGEATVKFQPNEVRVLIENGILGKADLGDEFFLKIMEISQQVNGIEEYLDKFEGTKLSVEQLAVVMSEKKLSSLEELNRQLALYDIPPASSEMFETILSGANQLKVHELLKKPEKIDIKKLHEFEPEHLSQLIESLVSNNNSSQIKELFQSITQESLKLDFSSLRTETFQKILDAKNTVDVRMFGEFIQNISKENIGVENAKLVNNFLENDGKGLFMGNLQRELLEIFDFKANPLSPKRIVNALLKGGKLTPDQLATMQPGQKGFIAWDNKFYEELAELAQEDAQKLSMVLNGKPEFFTQGAIELFMKNTLPRLSERQQSQLEEVWGDYKKHFQLS